MKPCESVLFSILKSSLWGIEITVPSDFNEWEQLFVKAKAHAVLALVADKVFQTPELRKKIPQAFCRRLKDFAIRNYSSHARLNNTLIQIVSELDNHGVHSVLLKGQGLARCYPVPELRQCGDIDLYVGDENAGKVYDLLMPVADHIDPKGEINLSKHFHVTIGALPVEIHRYSDVQPFEWQDKIYQAYADEGLSSDLHPLDFSGVLVNTPSDNFNAFYIFNHLWHHFRAEGVGLRQLCDWMMFLHKHHDVISSEYINNIVSGMDLLVPWKTFGCVLVDYLGLPQEEFPLYDSSYSFKARRLLKVIMLQGNLGQSTGYSRRRGDNYLYEKCVSLKCHLSIFISEFSLFPLQSIRQAFNMFKVGIAAVFKDMVK